MVNFNKKCKVHGIIALEDCYYNKKHNSYSCKKCRQIYNKKYQKTYFQLYKPRKNIIRKFQPHYINRWLGKYKLTKDQYLNLLSVQNNVCAICKKENIDSVKNKKTKLFVDHCHKTDIIRGLLCNKCNLGLGHFNDSIELMKIAIAYLAKF